MMNQDAELETFKREIDLRQFAVSLGYEIDRRESWRGSTVLRRGADKIVVKRNGNGHYVFFSVRDDGDNGTVIDFLQRRQHLSLGAVRQILRPWIGRPATSPQFSKLVPTGPDRMHVEGAYRRMANAQRFPYLEHERCVPAAVLLSAGLRGACGSTPSATRCFPISMPRGCADTRSRTVDSPALPPGAKRVCGSRMPSRTTGVCLGRKCH
jgi:hypothetical protein